MRRLPRLLVLAATLPFAACGGEGDLQQSGGSARGGNASGGDMLPAADVERVLRARDAIASCNARGAGEPGDGRSAGDTTRTQREATTVTRGARIDGATATLIDVYTDGPERIFQYGSGTSLGQPMGEILAQTRDRLEECDARRAAARIDRALASGG